MNRVAKEHFDEYPDNVRVRLMDLRKLVFQIVNELDLSEIDESLK
jgi:hypothetical protein